jgi:hypothetical protein
MAVIDLRQADIFINDGSVSAVAPSSIGANAAKGSNIITIGAPATGYVAGLGITIGTSLEYYVIEEVAGTSLTIAPPLVADVASADVVTPVGNMLEVKIGEGTLTYSEKRAVTYVLNRGRIYTVKLGDDAPVEVSLDFIWEFLRSPVGDPPTVEEALKQIGNASDWVSSSTDQCEPYAVNITICYIPPCGDSERIELSDFRWESLDHDLKAGTVAIKGNCNIAYANVIHGTG